MKKEELKELLADAVVDNNNISEEDIDALVEIINQCKNPDEAYNKISERFPHISAESLKADTEYALSKIKNSDDPAYQDLSDADLEAVAGGSFGSWIKDNWGYVVGVIVLAGVLYKGGKGIGKWLGDRKTDRIYQKAYKESYDPANVEGKITGLKEGLQDRGITVQENVIDGIIQNGGVL